MFGFLKKLFGIEDVDVSALLKQGALIVDVRSPQEFKGGHPKGAVNFPLPGINAKLDKIKQFNKPIVTCCASGRRSGIAADQLKKAGIEAYNGGSWNSVARAQSAMKS